MHTMTQQHFMALACGAVMVVKPPMKIARNANSRTSAFIFFIIRSHLLVALMIEVVAVWPGFVLPFRAPGLPARL